MLTTAEIHDYVARFSYKPGWTFRVVETEWEGLQIRIEAAVLNSYAPEKTTVLGIDTYLPRVDSYAEIERWMMWRIGRVEMHEMREWFKVDGKVVDDPHRPVMAPSTGIVTGDLITMNSVLMGKTDEEWKRERI